jgi:hypothetical protein
MTESSYLYYTAKNAMKILSTANWEYRGYTLVQADHQNNTIVLDKINMIFWKSTFEIKIKPTQPSISELTVAQVNTDKIKPEMVRKVLADVLQLF